MATRVDNINFVCQVHAWVFYVYVFNLFNILLKWLLSSQNYNVDVCLEIVATDDSGQGS